MCIRDRDIFLRQGSGEKGNGLAQPAVQPLPGVVFSDKVLFHMAPPAVEMLYIVS